MDTDETGQHVIAPVARGFRSYASDGANWFERALSWQSLVTAVTGVSFVGFFGIKEDFSIFVIGSVALLAVVGISLAFSLAANRKQRTSLILAVGFVCVVILASSLRMQHNREQRDRVELEKAADGFVLQYDRPLFSPLIVPNTLGPNGGKMLASIRISLVFDNNNPFDVWVKSFRRHSEIAAHASDNEQKMIYTKVPRGAHGFTLPDLTIRFDPPVEFSDQLKGTIDFEMCYGKVRNRLNKGFWQKVSLAFEGGEARPPYIIPANLEEGPYGYTDTCRG